jgi:hypothetical protein
MSMRHVIASGDGVLVVADPELGIAWVLPDPKAADDPVVAAAFAARNRATLDGVCPECGAVEELVPGLVVMEHEPECAVSDERIAALVEKRRSRRVRDGRGRGGIT